MYIESEKGRSERWNLVIVLIVVIMVGFGWSKFKCCRSFEL